MSQLLDSGHVGNLVTKLRMEFPNITEEEIINQVINKWDNTGLLDGLNGKFKKLVAFKLEDLATLFINNPELGEGIQPTIDVMSFPIVRRMLNEFTSFNYSLINGWGNDDLSTDEYFERNLMLYEILDVSVVVNKLINSFESCLEFTKDFSGNDAGLDNEAESCALLAKEISQHHKFVHRHHVLIRQKDGTIKVMYNGNK